MLEPLGLLGLLALGLTAFSLLVGRRVIDDRDRRGLRDDDAEPGEVSRETLGSCCGFGLPPVEQRGLDRAPTAPTAGKKPFRLA